MNKVRKINSVALNVYQLIFNILFILLGLALIGIWLFYLVKQTTPWNGIDENDAWGVLIIGFMVGFGMLFVVAGTVIMIILTGINIFSLIKIIKSKTRKTGFVFAIINTVSVFFSLVTIAATAMLMYMPQMLEGFFRCIPAIFIGLEAIAFIWNEVGLVFHCVTDISYFVAEKKKKDGIIG